MTGEEEVALFEALKQIHEMAMELLDRPGLPEDAKKQVLVIIDVAETALNAQNKSL
jgi:hypothetical protein